MGFSRAAVYLTALALLSHMVGERLPRRWFRPEGRFFAGFAWEQGGRVYERLGIRFWKDRVPDMSRLDPRMQRKQLRAARSREELERLVRETCVAETVHWTLIPLSPLLLWLWPGLGGAVTLVLYVLLGNLPFILIQRYNRPRLAALLRRPSRRERNLTHENSDPQL